MFVAETTAISVLKSDVKSVANSKILSPAKTMLCTVLKVYQLIHNLITVLSTHQSISFLKKATIIQMQEFN